MSKVVIVFDSNLGLVLPISPLLELLLRETDLFPFSVLLLSWLSCLSAGFPEGDDLFL